MHCWVENWFKSQTQRRNRGYDTKNPFHTQHFCRITECGMDAKNDFLYFKFVMIDMCSGRSGLCHATKTLISDVFRILYRKLKKYLSVQMIPDIYAPVCICRHGVCRHVLRIGLADLLRLQRVLPNEK